MQTNRMGLFNRAKTPKKLVKSIKRTQSAIQTVEHKQNTQNTANIDEPMVPSAPTIVAKATNQQLEMSPLDLNSNNKVDQNVGTDLQTKDAATQTLSCNLLLRKNGQIVGWFNDESLQAYLKMLTSDLENYCMMNQSMLHVTPTKYYAIKFNSFPMFQQDLLTSIDVQQIDHQIRLKN